MRAKARLVGIVLCALSAAACGGDGGDGSGGTAGSGGSGGTGGTGGGDTSTVTGVVYSWEDSEVDITVPGVTVGVFGQSISATTDANGRFTLQNVPNGDVFFTTEANGHWGLVDYYTVPDETGGEIGLNVITDAEVARWEGILKRSISASDGAVDILYYEGAEGGETGAIAPPAGDLPFTFDLWTPVDQTSIIVDRWMCGGSICTFGELLFPSVDPANGPITATVTGVPDTTTCHIDETPGTEYPIIAKSLTIVYAWCEPAQ
jgi:hypothetical protein